MKSFEEIAKAPRVCVYERYSNGFAGLYVFTNGTSATLIVTHDGEYDHGNWMLKIYKDRGKLTLEDIQQAATEWECDYYFLMMKCMDAEGAMWFDDDIPGDCVELYRATDVLKAWERVREK